MGVNKDWSLTLVRHYSPSAKKIEVATFYFGRDMDELAPRWRTSAIDRLLSLTKDELAEGDQESRDFRKLPSGLISLLGAAGLTDTALESGFYVEMSIRKPSRDPAWVKFVMLAEGTSRSRGYFGRTHDTVRVSYVEDGTENTVEFVPLHSDPMPRCIWVKVTELPPAIMANVVAEEILSGPDSEQTTLDEFTDLGLEDQYCRARELALPGPDWDGCCG